MVGEVVSQILPCDIIEGCERRTLAILRHLPDAAKVASALCEFSEMATSRRFDLNSVHHPFREAVAPQPMYKWRSDERRLARKRINLSRLNANIKAVRLYAHLGRVQFSCGRGGQNHSLPLWS